MFEILSICAITATHMSGQHVHFFYKRFAVQLNHTSAAALPKLVASKEMHVPDSIAPLQTCRCGKTYGHLWTSGFPFRKIICPRGIYLLHCLLMTLEMPLLVLWPCTEDLQWVTASM